MVECDDKTCFKHGDIKTRGAVIEGRVVSDRGKLTAVIERDYTKKVRKYERQARKRSRLSAHNPICIDAKEGDVVRAAECRKISKTKSWTIIEIIQKAEKK